MKNKINYLIMLFVIVVTSLCANKNIYADEKKEIVVLYTNDAHNAYEKDEECLGYTSIAAYKKQLENEGCQVILVDGGDAIQGGVIGTLSKGKYIVDIMEQTGYSIAIPGNHEFDFGMDNFLDIASKSKYEYISCNFIDLRTNKPVFEPYKIVEFGDINVAFLGITTPCTFTSSTPKYFQDDKGNYIYGFCEDKTGKKLYKTVQKTIDAARKEGADYVIAIGHVGIEEECHPWTSEDIVSNVSGIDAFLDAHSHSVIPSDTYKDKEGNKVVICSTGTKLSSLGKLVIKDDGTISTELIDEIAKEDIKVSKFIMNITRKFEKLVNKTVAKTDVDLVINDPKTGERIVRSQETNLGDLCADAYRTVMGADIGFANGGGVRVDIQKGNITYGDIINVNPFGNAICMIEAKGQEILDALEMGAMTVGESENGGFLQVSGLTYEIDTTVDSGVKCNEKGEFIKVAGPYRVKNVKVAGKPLDINKVYTLAANNYMLKNGGDGYTMFMNCNVLKDEVMLDNETVIKYISENLEGHIKENMYANPYGEGRITIITEKENVKEEETVPVTGDNNKTILFVWLGLMAIFAYVKAFEKVNSN
ncbi:MAG: bifunctional metallophosphatase/5'-nucleotidase [Lachnospiraceae bacterium]|nr:bifunctional metallophosphatase/5'-nucleotidase [Lachnospiraceae bacterium]